MFIETIELGMDFYKNKTVNILTMFVNLNKQVFYPSFRALEIDH